MILKRKTSWVKRYALVHNCHFHYKNKSNDASWKMQFDLRKAKVMLGQNEDNKPYMYFLPDPDGNLAIRICFEEETTFNKWLEVV